MKRRNSDARMPRKITRQAAKARGLTRYYTGKPCKRGHVVERRVSTRDCMACKRETDREAQRRYHQSPKDRETRHRYQQSPKGRERDRRYKRSPKGRENDRRYDQSPKGIDRRCRYMHSEKNLEYSRNYERLPRARKRANLRRRELRLDRALDYTRDDYSPVRVARLLARRLKDGR